MKSLFILNSIVLIFLNSFTSLPPDDDAIVGTWQTENENTHIKIYEEGGQYYGKIVWLKEPNEANGEPKKDTKNPRQELRNRPIEGLVIITGLEYDDGEWVNGSMYAPQKGQYIECSLEMNDNGELEVTVSKSIFSQTKVWKRL